MKKYDKLVRDNIPSIIHEQGKTVQVRSLNTEEFKEYLKKKFYEEATEFFESESLEELADIVEVVYALAEVNGHSVFDLGKMRRRKLFQCGGYVNRICLEYVGD